MAAGRPLADPLTASQVLAPALQIGALTGKEVFLIFLNSIQAPVVMIQCHVYLP